MKRYTKGQYGYRDYHRNKELIKIIIGAFLIAIQLLLREFTNNDSAKNILTVMAVLSVLPVANIAVPILAAFKYRTSSKDFYNQVTAFNNRGEFLYDLVLTSKEQVIPLEAVVIHETGIYAYCAYKKTDTVKAERFLTQMLLRHKLDREIKIFLDEKIFFNRIRSLKTDAWDEGSSNLDQTVSLLKSLSI
ncbi:O-linked GlcNAc transferase-like protein [Clostridium sp. E02]|uniref:O-linked GlcNAc transferase-like protein n=1 Tax=Clostridium sp. E02 TaxID=2487134 RepID=UPI000F51F9D9|nr:O-linked GlcNAc transferase-like protein [Clostridium sp. E02]